MTLHIEMAQEFEIPPRWRQQFTTVKPVCNDHLYNEIYYLWFIQ